VASGRDLLQRIGAALAAAAGGTCQPLPTRQTAGATATAAWRRLPVAGNWPGWPRSAPFAATGKRWPFTADGVAYTCLFRLSGLRPQTLAFAGQGGRPGADRAGLDGGLRGPLAERQDRYSEEGGPEAGSARAQPRQRPTPRWPTWAVRLPGQPAGGKAPRTSTGTRLEGRRAAAGITFGGMMGVHLGIGNIRAAPFGISPGMIRCW